MGPSRARGLASVAALIACATACVVVLVAFRGSRSIELLCSDEKCGEGSKLSQVDAVKDLDKYADKAELKDRLDELQTVMERGMTHKDEVNQLNSYFNDQERRVASQRRHALRQAHREGFDFPALSSPRRKAVTPSLHTKAQHAQEVSSSRGESSSNDGRAMQAHGDSTKLPTHTAVNVGRNEHAKDDSALSSAAVLNRYFDKQASKIQEENQRQLHSSKLSASQAEADLDKYFDSLNAHTKSTTKMQSVVKKLDQLESEVHSLKEPVTAMRGDAESTKHTLKSLENQNRALQADNKRILALDASRMHRESHSEYVPAQHFAHVTEALTGPKGNQRVKMAGLPPAWEAFLDRTTRYPYFYNKDTGKSTWDNPRGKQVQLRGLPRDWEAFKDAKGDIYYANTDTGESSFDDPRVVPGAKVLKLVNSVDTARSRLFSNEEKTAKLAAVTADHGVYGHTWPRSQWADRGWMKFLTSSNAQGQGTVLTNGQQLRMGMMGSQHAPLQQVASDSY